MSFYDDENKGFGYNGGDYIDPSRAQETESSASSNGGDTGFGQGYYGGPSPIPNPIPEPAPKKVKQKRPKGEHRWLGFIGKVAVAAVIFGLVSGGIFYGINRFGGILPAIAKIGSASTEDSESVAVPGNVPSTAVSTAVTVTDVSDIVENVLPSIVKVTNVSVRDVLGFFGQRFQQEGTSLGSGFIIGQDEKYIYIATNNHVISNSKEMTITFFDDTSVAGELQGAYPDGDVAVVRVEYNSIPEETRNKIKLATLGDSKDLKVGEATVVIGNSMGNGISVSTGVVSALEREISVMDDNGKVITTNCIQTDAAVNSGNSGGAILNMNGEVIGIVSAKYHDAYTEGMGYAIPIHTAGEIINQLIDSGTYTTQPADSGAVAGNGAFLGIYSAMDIDSQTAAQYDMPQGIYISSVVDGSPAQEAGITKGDIITAFNGTPMESMKQLQETIAQLYPGDTVTVTFAIAAQNYMEKTATITLAIRPAE